MSEETVTYKVHIHNEGPDGLWAEVEELPGCFASGFDHEELRESLEEAIGLYLSTSERRVQVRVAEERERVEQREFTLCPA